MALFSMLGDCLLFFLFFFPVYVPNQSIPPFSPGPHGLTSAIAKENNQALGNVGLQTVVHSSIRYTPNHKVLKALRVSLFRPLCEPPACAVDFMSASLSAHYLSARRPQGIWVLRSGLNHKALGQCWLEPTYSTTVFLNDLHLAKTFNHALASQSASMDAAVGFTAMKRAPLAPAPMLCIPEW